RAEAAQTGELCGAVWSAASGSCPSLCYAPLSPTDGRLCPLVYVARAAEAEDPVCPPDDPLAHRRPAAGTLCDGRPALGRSDHARIPQPPGRSRPDGPHPCPVYLSSRLPPALDGARAPHPHDAITLAATPGRGDDRSGRARQGAAR